MNGKRNLIIRLATCLVLSTQVALVAAQEPVKEEQYLVGSGVPGSVPYNIGVGLSSLAQLVLLPEASISLSPATTDGYYHNLQHIIDGTGQFAIVDSVSAHQAAAASGDVDGGGIGDQLRVVATLWHEVDHFIIANEYVQSGTISDLAILRTGDLVTDLGNFDAARELLSRFGVRIDGNAGQAPFHWETERDNFDKGKIAGLAITGTVPSEAVQEMLAETAGEELAKIQQITSRIMAIYDTHDREPEVYVEGHTDSSGSWETNYEIAHRRARSVSDLFIANGVPETWIHIADYSEQGLAVPTADGVAEERNRRVEITVIPQD